ncbi:MAG TPA: endonuclease/exonuclease/phosphatase family protein [Candidatus Alistipes excrementipullorum]|nr:endonuclease/exonuclease/phosphatase family protein [Candidatus Alistipes excrementipullorum]
MSEYYSSRLDGKRKSDKRKRNSLWGILLNAVMAVVSVVTAFCMFMIFIGGFVPPEKLWYFSLLGLVSPIIYVLAMVSLLYWIVRWKWRMAAFMMFFVFIGLFRVSLYYKIDITREYEEPQYDRDHIKVLSYNIRQMRNDKWQLTADSIRKFIADCKPDIICFQESHSDIESADMVDSLLRGYNATRTDKVDGQFVRCYSKFRIIRCDSLDGMCGTGSGIWADMRIGSDTVRVFNVHLQTTSITADDKEYIINHRFISDSTRENKMHSIARRLYDNSLMRARQVEALHAHIAESPYPVILCGDFNDVPMSYAYRTASRGLTDTFSEQGHGYAHTFRGFFNMLRIDYILVSDEFETLSYEVPRIAASDHYPVFVRLKLDERQQ